MSHSSYTLFVARSLVEESGTGLRAVEVGSYDPAGGFRVLADLHGGFSECVGVDIREGPGIDEICDAEDLVDRFGRDAFDVVIATELLEHVRDWRKVLSNIKGVCRPGGVIILTTRSPGYGYHAAPFDFWRYEPGDMEKIFADCRIVSLEDDPEEPGVFLKARKPLDFKEAELSDVRLQCILTGRRELDIHLEEIPRIRLLIFLARAKFRQLCVLLLSPSRKDFLRSLRLQANEALNLFSMLRGKRPTRF